MWEVIDSAGIWKGEICSQRKNGSLHPQWLSISQLLDAKGHATEYIGTLIDITQRKEDEANIHRLAHFDVLTGLPNRTLIKDRTERAISSAHRKQEQIALLFIDLDHFKNINDTLGHHVGDEMLIEVAKRMISAVREEDTVTRQGGDEFILVLSNIDTKGAAQVAEKLLGAISHRFVIEGQEFFVTPSIGIAMYPEDGKNFDDLAKRADAAMYRAKQNGRNTVCFFTPEMQNKSARTLQLDNALRKAEGLKQLSLHYQPQISMQTGRVIGAEALLRWNHPEMAGISPAEFIPLAESSGQILQIGEWVLQSAVRQLRLWIDSGIEPISIAVNLSAVQFRLAGLPNLITKILIKNHVSPEYLELELTESAAMSDPISAIKMMDELHNCGIRMLIDDFGTGYSSLSYLKRFKIYKLKIDQSFVRDLYTDTEDKAIVSAIISLANSLGIKTIAEGVETPDQLAFLRLQGCNEVQGYYFSKPLPADAFEAFLRRNRATLDIAS